jgi:hypothetical protein
MKYTVFGRPALLVLNWFGYMLSSWEDTQKEGDICGAFGYVLLLAIASEVYLLTCLLLCKYVQLIFLPKAAKPVI